MNRRIRSLKFYKSYNFDQAIRYFVIALLNSFIGYGVFLVGCNYFSFSPYLSNILAYIFGIILGLLLNYRYVFFETSLSFDLTIRFLISFIVSFFLNQIVLYAMISFFYVRPNFSQLTAMLSYSVLFYFLNKYYVWND
jgi:putative flippase GtrA